VITVILHLNSQSVCNFVLFANDGYEITAGMLIGWQSHKYSVTPYLEEYICHTLECCKTPIPLWGPLCSTKAFVESKRCLSNNCYRIAQHIHVVCAAEKRQRIISPKPTFYQYHTCWPHSIVTVLIIVYVNGTRAVISKGVTHIRGYYLSYSDVLKYYAIDLPFYLDAHLSVSYFSKDLWAIGVFV